MTDQRGASDRRRDESDVVRAESDVVRDESDAVRDESDAKRARTDRFATVMVRWTVFILLIVTVFYVWQQTEAPQQSEQLQEQLDARDAILANLTNTVDTFDEAIDEVKVAVEAAESSTIGPATRAQLDAALPLVFDIYAMLCASNDVTDRPANCPTQVTP